METKHYYFLSIIVFIAGLVAFGNYVYSKYVSLNELLVEFTMPGEVNISIDSPGMYDIYYEDDLKKNNAFFYDKNPEKPFSLIVKNNGGVSMPLQLTEASKKYSYRGRRGESVYEVNLPRAGIYEFIGVINKTEKHEEFTLFLDKGFSESRSRTIVAAQAILLFPIVASLVLFLNAYSKNRQ